MHAFCVINSISSLLNSDIIPKKAKTQYSQLGAEIREYLTSGRIFLPIPIRIFWARNAFTTLGMMDYPYPTNFLCPLPAFPIDASCKAILNGAADNDVLTGLTDAAGLVYNQSSNGKVQTCFDIESEYIECADQTGCGVDYNSWAWDYQACTEIILLVSTNNITDMFPAYTWDLDTLTTYCEGRWGVKPRPEWTQTYFGGNPKDPAQPFRDSASKIIFSKLK